MPDPMLVWVTRSSPFHLRSSRELARMGHKTFSAPTLEIEATDVRPPAIEPTAIAFTSAHAVRHHPMRKRWRSLPVFTVGDQCARLAREAGYGDVRSADGSVSELRDLVLGSVSRFGHVVHFGARAPAGDLVEDLRRADLSAELSIVYESLDVPAERLGGVTASLSSIDAILVHSPRGARVAAVLVRQAGWRGRIFALSQACAAPFQHLPGMRIEIAPAPNERALMDLIAHFGARNVTRLPVRLIVSNGRGPPPVNDRDFHGHDDPPPFAA